MSDSRERELERAAIGGDRDAQTKLRELWRRTGRDLLPSLIDPRMEAWADREEWAVTVEPLDLMGRDWREVAEEITRLSVALGDSLSW